MGVRILVGCETSGKVREAFRRRGHEAWSCDLLPADDGSLYHFQMDLRQVVRAFPAHFFDLMVVHPECTYLCVSGLHWNKRRPERAAMTEEALQFVAWLFSLHGTWVRKLVLENPRGCIGTRLGRNYDQTIQPYQFGDDASKQTDLWLFGVEPLVIDPSKYVEPRLVCDNCATVFAYGMHKCPDCRSERYKPRWANQTDSGQNRLGPSNDRWKLRSETYDGISNAFAENWG